MPVTAYDELCRAFKLKLAEGESFEDFAAKASDRVNKCTDAQWKELSGDLQTWTNETLKVREANLKLKEGAEPASLPVLDGFPGEGEEGGDAEEPADDAEDSEEAEEDADEEEPEEETVDAEASEGQDAESNAEGEDDEEDSAEEQKPKRKARPEKGAKPSKEKEPKTMRKVTNSKAPPGAVKRAAEKKTATANARNGGVSEKATIKVVAKTNPHREGTKLFNYFKKYKDDMTVAQLLKAGVPPKNIAYLKGLGHIKLIAAKG
jgi:hypothetical protein